MLNEKAVPFFQIRVENSNKLSNEIELDVDNIVDLSKICYDLTNNTFFNFCPNCRFNNVKYDFKFCPDCGTSLHKR